MVCDTVNRQRPQGLFSKLIVWDFFLGLGGALRPLEDGRAYAWGDVSDNELNPELTPKKARKEEMEQFMKHEVYEKVREDVC